MTRISRFQIQDDLLDKLFILFFEIVGKKKDVQEFKNTLIDLLSPTERIMIAKRLAIIYLLLKKIDYSTISNVLKVSPSTIAKFHYRMETSQGIVPTFKRLLQNERVLEFFEELYLTFRGPGVIGTNWNAAWKKQRDFERKKRIGI